MIESNVINKTMDVEDLKSEDAQKILTELNTLINKLKEQELKISSWYGNFNLTGDPSSIEFINRGYNYQKFQNTTDDKNFPWFLYWEIVWVYVNNIFTQDMKILDLGGSSSLFSYFLASKGLDVTTIDIQSSLVKNANEVSAHMGWNLKNYVMDMRNIDFQQKFDHITSICVYEHIPLYDRIQINKKVKKIFTENGKFSITFDFRNPSNLAKINSSDAVFEQFVQPSGLKIRGNQVFFDNGINYLLHPFFYNNYSISNFIIIKLNGIRKGHFNLSDVLKTKNNNDYTFGALFLENAN